jgi:hypothetical protein
MSVTVNNRVVRTFYSKHFPVSRISQSILQPLSMGTGESENVLVPVTVAADASPQICSCSISCVVDDSLHDVDLVLGADWFAKTASVLSGSTVVFDNGSVSFPSVITRSQAGVLQCEKITTNSFASSSTSTEDARHIALDIIYDVFCSYHGTRARTSAFSSSISVLTRALQLHGIQADGLSSTACQDALICHYVSGNCFVNSQHATLSNRPQTPSTDLDKGLCEVSTCANIAKGFCSSSDLSTAVLNILKSSTDISTVDLERITDALGIHVPFGSHHLRHRIIVALENYSHCTATPNLFPVLPQQMFMHFEKFRKQELLVIARHHGLASANQPTVESLQKDILRHVASGMCVDGSNMGCRVVRDNFASEDISCDAEDLKIHLLSMVCKGMSCTFLKRILNLCGVPFSVAESVSGLNYFLHLSAI